MKIFVAGLPYDLDDAELEEIFEKFGPVVSAKVALDKETGKSKGFGFVEMATAEDAQKAIQALNGHEFMGRPLTVNEAREQAPRSGGGGGGGGGGFGGGGGGRGRREY